MDEPIFAGDVVNGIGKHVELDSPLEPSSRRFAKEPRDVGSGGVISTNSPIVIRFPYVGRRRRRSSPAEVPSHCRNGLLLTFQNVAVSSDRWRCRQCGAERAARLRDRRLA